MNRHLKPRIIIERCHIHLLNGLRAPTLSQTVCEVPETKKMKQQFVLSAELSGRGETDIMQFSSGQDVL